MKIQQVMKTVDNRASPNKHKHKTSTATNGAYSQCIYNMNHNILIGKATINPL